ncbi:helix-turn-helix transcriptional regulator [Arabiibacter massiliensis]|uniref:helix-turn-helix transcriptional regulator n=1 Tax=Arabiibacter massiliensis TaxID=1870985 RepID=UPI0009BA95FE|nr:helix-turn-helix transcriptional regulator [Arabiibacter massiliensis]
MQVDAARRTRLLVAATVVGFGLLQGARLLDLGTGPYSPEPYAVVGVAAGGLAYLGVAVLSYLGRLDRAMPLFVGGCCALAARVVLAAYPETLGIVPFTAALAGGVGWALIILCWMQVLASYRPSWAVPMIAAGYVVDTLLVPASTALFPGGRDVVFIVALAASLVILGICMRAGESVAKVMMPHDAPAMSMAELAARTRRAVAGAIVFSASCGFVVQLDIASGVNYAQTAVTSILGVAVSSALCLAIVLARPKKASIDVAFPVSALALMSVLLFRSANPADTAWTGPLMVVLLITFFCLIWMAFTSEAYERKLPSLFLLGLAVGASQLSIAAGRALAATGLGELASQHFDLALTAIVWLLGASMAVLLLSYLWLFARSRERRYADAPDEMNEPTGSIESLNAAALELLRDTYDLSAREFQVVGEFSSGRSARYIADFLVLSEHTVKTHLRRAYAKLGVHSRQELLNLIDRMEAQIHRQR